MLNILKIFWGDLKKISRNAIAWIVVLGLSVVPALYAWFNIAASWDPYSNTNELKVAVASVDEGYTGNLMPINLNLGNQVISSLRENEQLDWVFTDKEDAIDGVKSGKYYASIVIPKKFSTDMMSLFSNNVSHSDIIYYLNEKENAIAPKITDKGASAVQKQIDKVFTKTVSEISISVLEQLSDVLDEKTSNELMNKAKSNINQMAEDLGDARDTFDAFADMTGSLEKMLNSTSSLLKQTGKTTKDNVNTVKISGKNTEDLKNALDGTTDGINKALSQSATVYNQLSKEVDTIFESVSKDADTAGKGLTGFADQVGNITGKYVDFRDSLEEIKNALPDNEKLLRKEIDKIIGKIDQSVVQQNEVKSKLTKASKNITTTTNKADKNRKSLTSQISKSAKEIKGIQKSYENNLQSKLKELTNSLTTNKGLVEKVVNNLSNSTGDVSELAGKSGVKLGELKKILKKSANLLDKASGNVKEISAKLDQNEQSSGVDLLKNILSNNPDTLSSFLSSPVKMNTNVMYKVDNYGSAMAPFYSTLAIWVGGIVLVAMLKVTVEEKRKKEFFHVKNYQLYFGRYILFLIIGLIQSGLICLGDLYFLKIQCQHPFLFILAGWVSSIVYVNIIYTLTVSFGDVGKAISVILLVMQVAGSGGTFPIEVAPKFFRTVYPLLPFNYSMGAMRETIAGMYGNTYQIELLKLLLFLIPSLTLGLVLRKPIIKLNDKVIEKLEETKLM
ncbi:YhgE/Pip family protein [Eubacterium sp.]|uniref:YhgE/Pip family protein n=1 Tax=Eubacterium sp. TaxID=142586 RepID=UPI0039A050D5